MFKLLVEDSRLVDFAQSGFERGVFLLDLLIQRSQLLGGFERSGEPLRLLLFELLVETLEFLDLGKGGIPGALDLFQLLGKWPKPFDFRLGASLLGLD